MQTGVPQGVLGDEQDAQPLPATSGMTSGRMFDTRDVAFEGKSDAP